jgi:hypothetical protein
MTVLALLALLALHPRPFVPIRRSLELAAAAEQASKRKHTPGQEGHQLRRSLRGRPPAAKARVGGCPVGEEEKTRSGSPLSPPRRSCAVRLICPRALT